MNMAEDCAYCLADLSGMMQGVPLQVVVGYGTTIKCGKAVKRIED